MTAIQDLIDEGIAQFKREGDEAVAKQKAEDRRQKEKHQRNVKHTLRLIKAAIADELEPFAVHKISQPLNRRQWVGFDIPGCCRVRACYKAMGQREEKKFILDFYQVDYATSIEAPHRGPPTLHTKEQRFDHDLIRALGFATLWFEKKEELLDDLVKAQAEYEAEQEAETQRHEETERAEEESLTRRQAEREQEDADLKRILDIVRNDPAALALVRTFAAIQGERLSVQETLDDMRLAAENRENRYRRRLNEAERAAMREADRAQRCSYAAEDELEDAKRKTKRA